MTYYAKLKTTEGEMKIKLFHEQAPNTVNNFLHLCQTGFYNGIQFHRVIKDFMIQAGCPQGNGTGGPGYRIKDEFCTELEHDSAGILSMANTGQPNTNGSQFFITLAPTPWLDGRHTVFGELVEGDTVLKSIGGSNTDLMDRPENTIRIESVELFQDEAPLTDSVEEPERIAE